MDAEAQFIQDDIALLDCMIEDQKNASSYYQPGERTAAFMDVFIKEIRKQPLHKTFFEGTRWFNAIGACNFPPARGQIYTLGRLHENGEIDDQEYQVLLKAAEISSRKPTLKILPYEISQNDLNETAYKIADTYGRLSGARPLSEISMSLSGRPEYYFTIEGQNYSHLFLYNYMRYAFCCNNIDFNKINNFIELGCGSGRMVEIIRKFHSHINFYLLDLPPQLYLSHQFLKSIFGSALISYQQTRNAEFRRIATKGNIAFLPPSRIETISPEGSSLSWTHMVFSTMDSSMANNYLRYIKKLVDSIYIAEPIASKDQTAETGKITFDFYNQLLSSEFKNVARSRSVMPLGYHDRPSYKESDWGQIEDTFWVKKK